MFIIQFILKIVFLIVNFIFRILGYNTDQYEKQYMKKINSIIPINSNINNVNDKENN